MNLDTTLVVDPKSRTAATSKMECFVIIVNGWKPLTIITKHSILDVAAALDPPLLIYHNLLFFTQPLHLPSPWKKFQQQ